jgi:chromosome segregation ATPase
VKLNMTKAKNEGLRREINLMRKELTSSRNECARFEKTVKKAKKEAELNNKDYQVVSKLAEETNNQIIALQAKHEEEKARFEIEIQKLQMKLKEKDEVIEMDNAHLDKNLKDLEETAKGSLDFTNPIVILKRRLLKITDTNREKRRLMDQYLRNVKVIEDAFDQIQEATGISNIEEIVTTFIKAEEQNYSLQNYVNMLNTELD